MAGNVQRFVTEFALIRAGKFNKKYCCFFHSLAYLRLVVLECGDWHRVFVLGYTKEL
jgi:hypothetical protein